MSTEQLAFYQQKLLYEIDSWDLFTKVNEGKKIVIVDGRSSQSFEKEHIPGAISVPHRTISQDSLAKLDKSALYVTYCDGIGCNASTKTALKMLTLGFSVQELLGGLDWWKRDGYATMGAQAQDGAQISCGCAG